MNLKTLKDIRPKRRDFDEFRIDLKQEAIKWVRHYKVEIEIINRSKDRRYLIKDRNLDKIKLQNRIIALMDFHNLTQEDLE